jgi:hypothetical protein
MRRSQFSAAPRKRVKKLNCIKARSRRLQSFSKAACTAAETPGVFINIYFSTAAQENLPAQPRRCNFWPWHGGVLVRRIKKICLQAFLLRKGHGVTEMSKQRIKMAALPVLCGLSVIAAIGLTPTASVAATVVITPISMGSWAFDHRDLNGDLDSNANGTGQLVNGPATPPLGTGSAQLATGNGTTNGDGAQELRNTGYNEVALSTITTLMYSTYATQNNGQQFPYLGLMIATSGSGSPDDIIFFEPPYQQPSTGNGSLTDQGATALNTWQTWDALAGGWWANSGDGGCDPGTGVCALSNYLAAHPNAAIVNTDGGLGGVRFDVGFASANDQFNGYVDNFTIGIMGQNTTFDFELTAPSAVPLPAALPLFSSGLGVLGYLGWRKRRKRVAQAAA